MQPAHDGSAASCSRYKIGEDVFNPTLLFPFYLSLKNEEKANFVLNPAIEAVDLIILFVITTNIYIVKIWRMLL